MAHDTPTLLVFDSGIGGLTILREARVILPGYRFVYVGDDAGFPYGDWEEDALVERMVSLFDRCLDRFQPLLAIVACNTASTLIMPALRSRFDIPFVGTVPAIKPAAQRTQSGLVSVLATPGTINRQYTRNLISEFALDIDVNLVASSRLARMAEDYMSHKSIDPDALLAEIRPCFLEWGRKRTDIVVMGCTHYPLLVNEMRKLAPWPVDWIDPAEAIARRVFSLLDETEGANPDVADLPDDLALLTSDNPSVPIQRLLQGFGMRLLPFAQAQ